MSVFRCASSESESRFTRRPRRNGPQGPLASHPLLSHLTSRPRCKPTVWKSTLVRAQCGSPNPAPVTDLARSPPPAPHASPLLRTSSRRSAQAQRPRFQLEGRSVAFLAGSAALACRGRRVELEGAMSPLIDSAPRGTPELTIACDNDWQQAVRSRAATTRRSRRRRTRATRRSGVSGCSPSSKAVWTPLQLVETTLLTSCPLTCSRTAHCLPPATSPSATVHLLPACPSSRTIASSHRGLDRPRHQRARRGERGRADGPLQRLRHCQEPAPQP